MLNEPAFISGGIHQLTEASHEIVEHAEDSGLPTEGYGESAVNGNGRRDGENGKRQVVELIPPVVPGDGGLLLLVFEGPGDIVVRDVDVYDAIPVASDLVLLEDRRGLGGSHCTRVDDGRHCRRGGRKRGRGVQPAIGPPPAY